VYLCILFSGNALTTAWQSPDNPETTPWQSPWHPLCSALFFLPVVLWEQFRFFSNFYFLCVALTQVIQRISENGGKSLKISKNVNHFYAPIINVYTPLSINKKLGNSLKIAENQCCNTVGFTRSREKSGFWWESAVWTYGTPLNLKGNLRFPLKFKGRFFTRRGVSHPKPKFWLAVVFAHWTNVYTPLIHPNNPLWSGCQRTFNSLPRMTNPWQPPWQKKPRDHPLTTQFIPVLQVGFLFTYIAPLVFVLSITILKEAYDDIKR